jgi:DNA-binding response OmpR family regulator
MDSLLNCSPDLVVLDLTLPDIDGLELLNRLRSFTQLPILVLSARESEQDKVTALTTGADDYLTKPFSAGEFVARIGVLLRRTSNVTMKPSLEVGDVVIDFVHRRVTRSGEEVSLTPTEYMSAVSKKLMPSSTARCTKGRLCSSASTHGRHCGVPYVIIPRHNRDTFTPLFPRFTYCIIRLRVVEGRK